MFDTIQELLTPFVKKTHSENEPKPHAAKENDNAEKITAYNDRLDLLREMLEEDSDNEVLKDRIELLEEMISEAGKFEDGGEIKSHQNVKQVLELLKDLANEQFVKDLVENPTKPVSFEGYFPRY